MNDGRHKQKKACLCFFDTARVHEEKCRDARVEDIRTSMHMGTEYSHEQDAHLFVFLYLPRFFPAHPAFSLC